MKKNPYLCSSKTKAKGLRKIIVKKICKYQKLFLPLHQEIKLNQIKQNDYGKI